MPEYKEYQLVGGQPVTIEPFDTAEAGEGVHFAKEGHAFNPVIVSGGGGNPNYVETITGTLANPFGSIDDVALAKEIADGDATATLAFTAEDETWVLRVCYDELYSGLDEALIPFFYVAYPISTLYASIMAYARVNYDVYADDDTEFVDEPVVRLQSANEETEVDPDTPCTLVIIHHPLPATP